MTEREITVAALRAAHVWRPIPDCPGRFVLSSPATALSPQDLVGSGVELREHRSAAARDPVIVGGLPDGGLISYRHGDGTYVHTLNTPEGFARKLQQLGIVHAAARRP